MNRRAAARVAAPVAFLLGVTIAVLLIHSGLQGGTRTTTTGPVTQASTAPVPKPGKTVTTKTVGARFYVVRKGDTFGAIAAREGTTVAELERLNPGVSSNSLHVGQKIRVR
ncbi:MAG TPA: LysM domain-containing protein [Gaiellaceae bacterium]|nr:LysM domain-containing protein [Gaiellaceae bacterium]